MRERPPCMNLNELVQKFGPMPADRVVYLLKQACAALMESHAARCRAGR